MCKKIIKIKEPFVLTEENVKVTIIDNGYYILEYMPFNENYICRIHIDDKKNVIEKFYIATKNNQIKNGIPIFDDLKLSYVCLHGIKKFYNEQVSKEILNANSYKVATKEMKKIKKEIEEGKNFIYNLNYKKYLI